LKKNYETQRKLIKSNVYPCYIPTNRVSKNQWRRPVRMRVLLTNRVEREINCQEDDIKKIIKMLDDR